MINDEHFARCNVCLVDVQLEALWGPTKRNYFLFVSRALALETIPTIRYKSVTLCCLVSHKHSDQHCQQCLPVSTQPMLTARTAVHRTNQRHNDKNCQTKMRLLSRRNVPSNDELPSFLHAKAATQSNVRTTNLSIKIPSRTMNEARNELLSVADSSEPRENNASSSSNSKSIASRRRSPRLLEINDTNNESPTHPTTQACNMQRTSSANHSANNQTNEEESRVAVDNIGTSANIDAHADATSNANLKGTTDTAWSFLTGFLNCWQKGAPKLKMNLSLLACFRNCEKREMFSRMNHFAF